MLDIGAQIKRLREEQHLTGKDLAVRIGLSQSQMTRLEKGQRRIDTEILVKIAEALDVPPSRFFTSEGSTPARIGPRRERELSLSHLHSELGKLIRSERRKRHLTVDDLARKTGFTRAYVLAVEEGRRSGTDDDFLKKASRQLGLDPFAVLEMKDRVIQELKGRVNELDLRRSVAEVPGKPPPEGVRFTPILVGDETPYPAEFGEAGLPVAAVEGYLTLPDLASRPTFAVRLVGDEMTDAQTPVYRPGDLLVFVTDTVASHGDLAFMRHGDDETTFRRVFYDDESRVRLQALRPEVPPILLQREELKSAWPLVAHVRTLSSRS